MRFSIGLVVALYLSGFFASLAHAQEDVASDSYPRFIADVQLHTEEEMLMLLERAQTLLLEGSLQPGQQPAVTFVLHGPEVRLLTTDHYLQHRQVADLAASLSALGVVEIMACRTWMGKNDLAEPMLLPFVKTVPYGPAEERRLREQGLNTF
ncbi:MAG: acyl-CoA transferase [Halioglobus sp.]